MKTTSMLALVLALASPPLLAADQDRGGRNSMEGRIPTDARGSEGRVPATTGTGVSREGGTTANEFGVGGVTGGASGAAEEIDRGASPVHRGAPRTGASSGLAFDGLDRNGDNRLAQGEAHAHPALRRAFTALDRDGDGHLSASEYARFDPAKGSAAP